jgi:hypothetical protein
MKKWQCHKIFLATPQQVSPCCSGLLPKLESEKIPVGQTQHARLQVGDDSLSQGIGVFSLFGNDAKEFSACET